MNIRFRLAGEEKLMILKEQMLREMYLEAEPSADLDELRENRPHETPVYKQHYLPMDDYLKILDKYFSQHNLTEIEENRLIKDINLGIAPVNHKEGWIPPEDYEK